MTSWHVAVSEGFQHRAFSLVSRFLARRDQPAERALHGPETGDLPGQLRHLLGSETARLVAARGTASGAWALPNGERWREKREKQGAGGDTRPPCQARATISQAQVR